MPAKFQFRVVGRFRARLSGNEDHVTLSVLAGDDWEHLSLCGTLTMTEAQWDRLVAGMERGMPDGIRIEGDRSMPSPRGNIRSRRPVSG